MLFDHDKDPDENYNVVDHSAYQAVVIRVKKLLNMGNIGDGNSRH